MDKSLKSKSKAAFVRYRKGITLCAVILSAVFAVCDGYMIGEILGVRRFDPREYQVEEFEPPIEKEIVAIADDTPIVNLAMAQVGNEGGDKFWSWYGFGGRVPWCACYTSWCADELGYISSDRAPRFAGVGDGIRWFQNRDLWIEPGETPSAGDLIFFDWEEDGLSDHVGIVTRVVDGRVFTVEGNSSNRCRVKRYALDAPVICGYGHIEEDA